jgi:hypothetical protein
MVTANYMFRPLTGHYQVVHPIKRGGGLGAVQLPFSLDVQPDGLLDAETCSC